MINLLKRLLILGALLVPNIAFAQTCIGTPPLTQIVVNNTIDICLPTNNANEISALALRQVLQTMTSAIFANAPVSITGTPQVGWVPIAVSPTAALWSNLFGAVNTWTALNSFTAGIATNNINSDSLFVNSSLVSGPEVVLSNTFGGANAGGGLLFNALNSNSTSITASFINCGFNVATAGSELSICDYGYRAPSSVNQIITTAVNSSSAGCVLCVGNTDNFWSLGASSVGYADIYSHLFTVIGLSGALTNPTPPISFGTYTQSGSNCVTHLALNSTTYGLGVTTAGNVTLCSAVGFQFYPNGGAVGAGTSFAISSTAIPTVNGTPGVSCTLTTVSHLTVVNGIVTLCN